MLVAVGLVACGSVGGPAGIDLTAVEAAVPAGLVPDHPEAVTGVSCPEMPLDGLGPVSCTAEVAGTEFPVKVTRPDRLDQMTVSAGVALVRAVDVADEVAERLAEDLGDVASVTCAPDVHVARSGQVFDCTVVDPASRAHRFRATLEGTDGRFRLDLVPKG